MTRPVHPYLVDPARHSQFGGSVSDTTRQISAALARHAATHEDAALAMRWMTGPATIQSSSMRVLPARLEQSFDIGSDTDIGTLLFEGESTLRSRLDLGEAIWTARQYPEPLGSDTNSCWQAWLQIRGQASAKSPSTGTWHMVITQRLLAFFRHDANLRTRPPISHSATLGCNMHPGAQAELEAAGVARDALALPVFLYRSQEMSAHEKIALGRSLTDELRQIDRIVCGTGKEEREARFAEPVGLGQKLTPEAA